MEQRLDFLDCARAAWVLALIAGLLAPAAAGCSKSNGSQDAGPAASSPTGATSSKVGTPCMSGISEEACGADGKSITYCSDGRWKERRCLGKGGCRPSSLGALCDSSIAVVDDACVLGEDRFSCTSDGAAVLECAHPGRWAKKEQCPTGKTCQALADAFGCK